MLHTERRRIEERDERIRGAGDLERERRALAVATHAAHPASLQTRGLLHVTRGTRGEREQHEERRDAQAGHSRPHHPSTLAMTSAGVSTGAG